MIASIWIGVVLVLRLLLAVRFLQAGALGALFGVSELLAVATNVYAWRRGRVDLSWCGMLLPVLHLPVLLFDLRGPGGPLWLLGLYFLLAPLQIALRLRMGLCCTVAAPCFVKLLDGWPYSWLRHPLAALELLLAAIVAASFFSPWNAFVFVLVAVCNVGCVLIEERFLMQFTDYREYARRVPSRYLPLFFRLSGADRDLVTLKTKVKNF